MKKLSWTSILTALALAVTTAYLLMVKQWGMFEAVSVLTLGMMVIIGFAIGFMLWMTPKQQRPAEWAAFMEGFNESLQAMINTIRGKQ